jgi:hypothetical protein
MLWYTKGCIYFRHLQLLSTPDNAEETFLNSLNAFKNSLKYKDKDLNSQINIELLLQQKEKMMAQAKKPREERVQQLTSPLVGASPNKGQF